MSYSFRIIFHSGKERRVPVDVIVGDYAEFRSTGIPLRLFMLLSGLCHFRFSVVHDNDVWGFVIWNSVGVSDRDSLEKKQIPDPANRFGSLVSSKTRSN